MSIVVRGWLFRRMITHVSAEGGGGYLSANSYPQQKVMSQILKTHQIRIYKKQPCDPFFFKKDDARPCLKLSLQTLQGDKSLMIQAHSIKENQYIFDRTELSQVLNQYVKNNLLESNQRTQIESALNALVFFVKKDERGRPYCRIRNNFYCIERGNTTILHLPTYEDGFKYGLSEIAFKEYVDQVTADFNIFSPNSADYLIAALKQSVDQHYFSKTISGYQYKIPLVNIANPSIEFLGGSVLGFTRHLRNEIFIRTLEDPQLPLQDKVTQVLKMEIMRLQDDQENIKTKRLSFFKKESALQKTQKEQALTEALHSIDDKQSAIAAVATCLKTPGVHKGGVLSTTLKNLKALQGAVEKDALAHTSDQHNHIIPFVYKPYRA